MMLKKIQDGKIKLALIGLGYVGLPLAVEFGKKFDTVGFDIKEERLDMLRRGWTPLWKPQEKTLQRRIA